MRRFDPAFGDGDNIESLEVIMDENAQNGEYVLWIDANGALKELQRKFDVLHGQYLKLDNENMDLQRELDPESMEGWDE